MPRGISHPLIELKVENKHVSIKYMDAGWYGTPVVFKI